MCSQATPQSESELSAVRYTSGWSQARAWATVAGIQPRFTSSREPSRRRSTVTRKYPDGDVASPKRKRVEQKKKPFSEVALLAAL